MMHKKIALCFLFFSGQALCMLVNPVKKIIQRPKQRTKLKEFGYEQLSKDVLQRDYQWNHPLFTQQLISDSLPIVMKHLDFKSNAYFLATCKYLHQTYKDKGFVLSPEAYMKEMIDVAQAGNKERVRFLISHEDELHKKQRELILQCFNINRSDLDDLDVIMRIYEKKYDSDCEDFTKLKTEVTFEDPTKNQIFCRFLLKQGFSPNKEDKEGNTLLSLAIEYNDLETIKLLLSHTEIDPNKEAKYGMDRETPLITAIYAGNSEAIKLLLGHEKIDPNKETKQMMHRETPLIKAIHAGNSEAIKLLLGHEKIDPNKETKYINTGYTPFYWAINKVNSEATKCLLENEKVDLHKENENGEIPLFDAAKNQTSNVEMLGRLLGHSKTNTNLFWYDFHYYVSGNPDFSKLLSKCTSYKARFFYWYGYIAGYIRRTIGNEAAIGYAEDILNNMAFLSTLLVLACLNHIRSCIHQ